MSAKKTTRKPATAAQVKKVIQGIKAPEGYTMVVLQDQMADGMGTAWECKGTTTVRLMGADIKLAIRISREDWVGGHDGWAATGSTCFKMGEVWKTFDRRGVDDSFHVQPMDNYGYKSIEEAIQGEIAKVSKHREADAGKVTVPVVGHRLTQEQVSKHREHLKEGGVAEFRPAGFGTGYRYSTRKADRWARRAQAELEAFFGVGPLWFTTLDCD